MTPRKLNKNRVMDTELGACMELTDGPDVNCCGTPDSDEVEEDREYLLNPKAGDGELSSASSSSESSLPSISSALLPIFSSNAPNNPDEEKEMLSGGSKSFTGLKLFTRR